MPLTAKELRELRAPLAEQIRQLADQVNEEVRDFTAEEQETWQKVNDEYNLLTRQIETAERIETIEADHQARPGFDRLGRGDFSRDPAAAAERNRSLALQAFLGYGAFDLTDDQEQACKAVGLNPRRRNIDMQLFGTEDLRHLQRKFQDLHPREAKDNALNFRADLSAVTGASGGYLVPPETLVRSLEVNMLAFGGMRQVSEIIRTATGEPMTWPTADDTSNTGEQLGEAASVGSSVDPSFAKVRWDAYKFSSKLIKVPHELLEDSAFNLVGFLGDMMGERLGRITNTKFTTGSGAATPKGITTAATLGVTAASATAIAADELIDLVHSVDPSYRIGSRFMMHDNVLLALRKLKDSNGAYMWQSGLQAGRPDTLLGYPVTINQDMASAVATTNKSVLFGQCFKYKIRSVGMTRMRRLDERYADNDQVAFITLIREDGNLLDAGTAPVKYLQQA